MADLPGERGTTARRFRLCDGKEFPTVTVPPAARILASRDGVVAHFAEGKAGAGRLVGTRVLEGVDAWSAEVAPGTVFAEAGGTAVCALEPDGRYRKFALTTGKVLADRKLNLAAPPVKLIVVPGIERDLVIARATLVPRFNEEKIAQQNYQRREKVLGKLFGIPANRDKPVWEHASKDFELDLYHSPDLPFVPLIRWGHAPAGEGQPLTGFSQMVLVDARTGTVFFDEVDRIELLTSSRMIALLGKTTILLPSSRTQFVLEYEREKAKDEKGTEKKE